MSYDLSRKNFNPLDDYLGVVMQQGRVQLDADWNTLAEQIIRRIQTQSLDTFGASAVPRETADGFLISGPANAIEIGCGEIYVDGLLAKCRSQTLKWDPRLEELNSTAQLSGADLGAAPTGPAGSVPYSAQKYYPDPPALPEAENYLVYVDVWQRDITYLQDSNLVDSAVGVDTTARKQIVWQVKYLDSVGDIDATTTDVDIPGWLETIHPSSARLSTATGDLVEEDNPCELPPQADYKGTENQFYRVEVHKGGTLNTATFKWSRDNAIVSSRIDAIPNANEIIVQSLGRDEILSFKQGDWIEITDDHRLLKGIPGELRRIELGGIDSVSRSISFEGDPLPIGSGEGDFQVDGSNQTIDERNTRVIRWDQSGIVFKKDETPYTNLDLAGASGDILIPDKETELFLENGILVKFDLEDVVDEADFEPEFKVGDYWTFAARVNDATVETLANAPPEGIHHHYAKLAIVNDSGIIDCRNLWPPESTGQGCACTVCVDAELHNNGTATIQQAVDQVIAAGGGTVCLSSGDYQISEPIRIVGNSVALRGQGWQTMLVARQPTNILDIGGERISTDIRIENMLMLTSVARGFSNAISVNNVFGLEIIDCFIANLASATGTSQAIQFTGLAGWVSVDGCTLIAERGIVGPRLQQDNLATLDFTIRDCNLNCSNEGINFSGTSFHINQLLLLHNSISNTRGAGIELSGAVLDNSSVEIENNILVECMTGIRCGLSNTRIIANDLEVDDEVDGSNSANAISLIDGLDPSDSDNLQIFSNRIRHYQGHGISVQTNIDKMMVKQNQIEDITGAAFIIEDSGAVEYLSLENNQFSRVAGLLPFAQGYFAALLLQATVRADISNNVFDGVVRNENPSIVRSGIVVTSSGDVNITSNRLYATTPNNYSGLGNGILVMSDVGNYEVKDNEVSRITAVDESNTQTIVPALWIPLLIQRGNQQATTLSTGIALNSTAFRANAINLPRGIEFMDSAPVFAVADTVYALHATRLVKLGPAAIRALSASVSGNRLNATSSTTLAAVVDVSIYCGFSDNEVQSDNADLLVLLNGDHCAANNNRIRNGEDTIILMILAQRFVVMGNMTSGTINVLNNGNFTPLPEPWAPLNIII